MGTKLTHKYNYFASLIMFSGLYFLLFCCYKVSLVKLASSSHSLKPKGQYYHVS